MPEYKRRYTFFESFYRATRYMTDEQRLRWYDCMNEFAFDGVEPDFDDPLLMSNWEQVCTTLTRSIKFAESGSKGGSKGAYKGASKHMECKGKECKGKDSVVGFDAESYLKQIAGEK